MLEAGQHIQDRFVVEELVGRGGLAEVYRVRHLQLGSVHALKLLLFRKKSLADRLLLEGRIQAQLRHPNVVAVTDVVVHDGQYGLLMEYVDNVTLEELIDSKGPMPIDEALECIAPVLAGVDAAHKAGVLHRDLKPANVLLARVAGGLVPKVSDFGIAKVLDESLDSATRENVAMGTPGYMAPEQVLDARGVDARTDVFALAGMLYELVAGRRAFADETGEVTLRSTLEGTFLPLNEVVEGVPQHVSDAVGQALSKERDDRPPSVQAFAEALLAEHESLLAMFHGSGQTTPITLDPGQFSNPGTNPGSTRSGSPVAPPAKGQGPTILPPRTSMSAAASPPAQQTYAAGEVASDSARRHTDPDPAPSRRKGPPPLFLTGALLALALLLLGGVGGVAAGFAFGVFGPPDRDQPVDLGLTEPIEGSVRLKAGEEASDDTDVDAVADASGTGRAGAGSEADSGSSRATDAGGSAGGGAVDEPAGSTPEDPDATGTAEDPADTDTPSGASGDTDSDPAVDEATTAASTEDGQAAGSGTEAAGESTDASVASDPGTDAGSAEADPEPTPPSRPMVMPMDSFLASSWDGKVYRQPFTLRVLQERNGDVVAEGRIVLGAQQRILRLTGRYDPYTGAMYLKETNGDLLLQGTVSGSSIDGTYQREGRGKPSELELVRR